MQINGTESGLPSLHGNRAYLFPTYRLPVNQILGYVCFITNSGLLRSLLSLCGNQEVNGYNPAGPRRGTERPLTVTATYDVGAGGSESAEDLLNSCLPSFGKSTPRQITDGEKQLLNSLNCKYFFLFAGGR